MGAFDTLRIAGSSLGMHQTWLDTLGHNIAKVNTARPTDQDAFTAQMLITRAKEGGGVEVGGVAASSPAGGTVNCPDPVLRDDGAYGARPAGEPARPERT